VFAQPGSPQSVRMSPSDLRVFGLDSDKRASAADEASSGNATADDIVAAGWLDQGCGAHSVRALRQLHRATQSGYDSCTGQHKVVNKGVSGRYCVVIWLTCDATLMCVGADQSTRLRCASTV